jgi:hypothetical protein
MPRAKSPPEDKRNRHPLVGAKRTRLVCGSALCGWQAVRVVGSVEPCPKCGGPVLVPPMSQAVAGTMRALGGQTVRVGGLSPDDVAALTDIGGGDPGHGASQVLRGYLAGRRVATLRKLHEKAPGSG